MATAWVKRHVPTVGHSDHDKGQHGKPAKRSASADAQHQHEKDFVIEYRRNSEVLAPEEVAEDPANKKLGASSQQLRLDDFELMKTLGTGQITTDTFYVKPWTDQAFGTGTFARVWLARVANPREEDKDKVFALKVLRKVDSKCAASCLLEPADDCTTYSHQVEASRTHPQ